MSNELPKVDINNLFEQDSFGQKIWKYHLGQELYEKYQPRFALFGRHGALATPLSDLADKHGPIHIPFDRVGQRVDEISYHPAYTKLRQLSYGQGIVAQKYTGDLMGEDKSVRHFIGFATGFYFAQTETGLFCPICMTDSLGRVLEIHAKDELSAEVLRRLQSSDLDEIWEGAMFLTEKQGGSDVGANQVYAIQEGQNWKLYGQKWFCSNADAGAILVLARVKDKNKEEVPGTKGLGLFLVTRERPLHNHKTWSILRLKGKLGVRSMASAEIQFNGTHGTLIGGAGQGFKMMTDMVNMSRLYNSVASLAIARRAILEAHLFAENRKAFGASLLDLPLYQTSLAELQAEFLNLHFMVFECVKQMDAFDQGDEEAGAVLRALTPLCKALSGKFSVFAAAEGMELIGGNAYIEEHILPRLYRDAQVLPIWEGTTQIQSLDLLRILAKGGFEALEKRLSQAFKKQNHEDLYNQLMERKSSVFQGIQDLQGLDLQSQQKRARKCLEDLARLVAQVLTYEALVNEPSLNEPLKASLHYTLGRNYATDPLGTATHLNSEYEKQILKTIV